MGPNLREESKVRLLPLSLLERVLVMPLGDRESGPGR